MLCFAVLADVRRNNLYNLAHGVLKFGFEIWADHGQKISDSDIDVMDIVTCNDVHPEIVIEAIRRGKYMLCEQPLAVDAVKAEEIDEAAEKAGMVNEVCFNYRQTPAVVMAKKMIAEGTLPKIYYIRAFHFQDWRADPSSPWVCRFSVTQPRSGALSDIGSHAIAYARFLLNEFAEVMAVVKTNVKELLLPNGPGNTCRGCGQRDPYADPL